MRRFSDVDEPTALPAADREINDAIERVFAHNANNTMPVVRGEMFSFEAHKTDVDTLSNDAVARIEQKLDAMMTALVALKARVDSIDTILARLIHRR